MASLCPQVFGMYLVKLAVAMVLAGGIQRTDATGTRVRGWYPLRFLRNTNTYSKKRSYDFPLLNEKLLVEFYFPNAVLKTDSCSLSNTQSNIRNYFVEFQSFQRLLPIREPQYKIFMFLLLSVFHWISSLSPRGKD